MQAPYENWHTKEICTGNCIIVYYSLGVVEQNEIYIINYFDKAWSIFVFFSGMVGVVDFYVRHHDHYCWIHVSY